MKELVTIQKDEKLNKVYSTGEIGTGGAYHRYLVTQQEEIFDGKLDEVVVGDIKFQEGPRNSDNSTPGVLDCDLLEIVRDRLACFQNGDYACEYNEKALDYIERALVWMNKRVEDRIARGVLGTEKK